MLYARLTRLRLFSPERRIHLSELPKHHGAMRRGAAALEGDDRVLRRCPTGRTRAPGERYGLLQGAGGDLRAQYAYAMHGLPPEHVAELGGSLVPDSV